MIGSVTSTLALLRHRGTYLFARPHIGWSSGWRLVNWLVAIRCRRRGHEAPMFYNVGGLEPDMRCQGCGDDLG